MNTKTSRRMARIVSKLHRMQRIAETEIKSLDRLKYMHLEHFRAAVKLDEIAICIRAAREIIQTDY